MKKLFFLLTAAIAAMSLCAAPVNQATAQKVAKNYLANEMYAGKIMASSALNPVLLKTEYSEGKTKQPVYYIFNTSTTYLVVSGDDRAEEILMVGDKPLNMDRIPDALQYLLDCYKDELTFLIDRPNLKVEKPSQMNHSLRAVTYGPYLTCNWDQSAPYYNQCKFTYNSRSYQCLTGCPATSAAMVMYYWQYPASVPEQAAYSGTLDIGSWSSNEVSYTYSALPATTFDWNNMKANYTGNYSTAAGTAVATLMRYVGQAEHMGYGVSGSGIPATATAAQIIATMFKNWGYKTTAALKTKSSYTATNWANLIIGEMAASRPVVYMGVDNSAGGHAFNVDGYRDSDSKYHVNFGWSGDGNSWYAMNAFSYGGDTFSSSQMAVVGIEAPQGANPVLTVNPTSLTFTANKGETVTKTFTVTGSELRGPVSVSVSGSYYNVSPTTITDEEAVAGATVTVTYKPTAAGTHTGTVTLSSSGAESKTVSLNGTATADPFLTVNPATLSFNTAVGTPVTQTFVVQGYNLTGGVTLNCSGAGFSIDKPNITKSAATNGSTVTVTYNPTAGGNHTGTITLTSNGADPVTVTLNGTAQGSPTINVNPTSLTFNTTVGTPVTKTFTVTGTDLSGNVSLAVSGTGFSIDKTNITKNDATSGVTVTVTYNPAAGGNHTGTVTLTSNGAQTKTVTLTGTATTIPSLNVTPASLAFNTLVGTPVTKTFNVTGVNLTGNVSLAVSGTGFTIDKTSITQANATSGTTVTVTYNPTAAGTHTGTVTLTSNGAQSVTVSLNGTAAEPVRTITATPSALNFTALVGEFTSLTFNVSGENLTGDLTLTMNDANGVYFISPRSIGADDAMAGNVPVTVTYFPNAFGTHSATITISGGGAPEVTVSLNGQADLLKYAPVMLPAIEEYINLTQFRADWTDETPDANVESYTLEVTPKAVEPVEPEEPVLLHSLSGSAYTGTYVDITLPAPWGGVSVRGGNGAIYTKNNYNGVETGYISYTIPEGYTNATFTLLITSGSGNYGAGNFTVASTQTPAVGHTFNGGETYRWLVTASSGEQITIYSTDTQYSPDIAVIAVYYGDATATAQLRATEAGDENGRVITGITDKYYTVENLLAEGTFLYRVKTIYTDGTESDWSNTEEVTLFQNGHGYELGDVNHDGSVSISDVTVLIGYLLSGGDICTICADVNGDNTISIGDVTALIGKLLSSDAKSGNAVNEDGR